MKSTDFIAVGPPANMHAMRAKRSARVPKLVLGAGVASRPAIAVRVCDTCERARASMRVRACAYMAKAITIWPGTAFLATTRPERPFFENQ